jgi:hypothetical protein
VIFAFCTGNIKFIAQLQVLNIQAGRVLHGKCAIVLRINTFLTYSARITPVG